MTSNPAKALRLSLYHVIIAILVTSIHARAQGSLDDKGIARFNEVVGIVNKEWLRPNATTHPHSAARAAVVAGKDPGPLAGRSISNQCEMLIFSEASRQASSPYQIAERATDRFVHSLDTWSSYMNPATWRQYNQAMQSRFFGIGMDLEQEKDGEFTCWPYPGSSAAKAGIPMGAELKEVDGRPVKGLSLYAVISQIRGPAHQPVSITFKRRLFSKTVNIQRGSTQPKTVFQYPSENGHGIRISRFGSATAKELAAVLKDARGRAIEIDLRDCLGGDLDVAAECAGYFLPAGTVVAVIRQNTSQENLVAPKQEIQVKSQVTLLQNRNTASSAEVFIQALTYRGRAMSVGKPTRGKGTTQSIMELSNGGALILTTGLLINPQTGKSWHGKGLRPTR